MRIGIVLANTPSYSETFFRTKISALKKAGHDVVLFCEKEKGYNLSKVFEPLPKNLIGYCKFIVFFIFHFKTYINFYKKELLDGKSRKRATKNIYNNAHILSQKLDWLHFGYTTMALNRENVADVLKAKMAVSFRGYDINVYPLKRLGCYDLIWQKTHKIHSISKHLLDKALSLGLPYTTPSQIIHPAIKKNLILDKVNTERNGQLTIVTIARLNWIKGVSYLIHVLKLLDQENIKYTCHIIGGGNKYEIENLNFLISDLEIKGKIRLCGKLSHIETLEILDLTDIYVQPSIGEGFCNSVLEAQARGKICIVTDAGGLKENIINNITGFVVSRYDCYELYKKIKEVYFMSDHDREIIIQNAQKNIRENYTIEKQQKEFLDFYQVS